MRRLRDESDIKIGTPCLIIGNATYLQRRQKLLMDENCAGKEINLRGGF